MIRHTLQQVLIRSHFNLAAFFKGTDAECRRKVIIPGPSFCNLSGLS